MAPENKENEEEKKMDGKSMRIKFTSEDGIRALKKFVQACNKNNAEYNEADEYLLANGNIEEIVSILKKINKKNIDDISIVFSAMQILIVKVAAKYDEKLINNTERACRLFIKEHIDLIHSMLSSNSNVKQRRVALKLLSAIVYLSIPLSRELLNHLSLHPEMVLTLTKQVNPKDPNSVRTCYIHFILAFLLQDNLQLTKAFLDKRAALSIIFSDLLYDSYDIVRMVLMTIKQHVLERKSISKTIKLSIFNNRVIESLINLYNWKGPDNCPYIKGTKTSGVTLPEEKEIVIETLHDFLLTLLTSKKHGIIFQDKITDSSNLRGNNQIINAVLKNLECPWEHEKPAKLIIEILTACPSLIKSQFNYVEPYLDPRISKKWIFAMRYVKNIIESINLNDILSQFSTQISPIQLSYALLNLCLPSKIVNNVVTKSIESKHIICRYEGIGLLKVMLTKVVQALQNINKSEFNIDLLNKNIKKYVIQNIPDPDTLLKVWNSVDVSDEETSCTDISVPSKIKYLDSIMELFLIYQEIIPDIVFIDSTFDPANFLNNLHEIEEDNSKIVADLKIKVIRFLLLVDPSIFEASNNIFEDSVILLVSENNNKGLLRGLLSIIFQGYADEIDIWIERISCIENIDERLQVTRWLIKIIKTTMENNEKYLNMISTVEEFKDEQICTAQAIEDILESLFNNTSIKDSNMHNFSTISPFLCCAIEKVKTKSKSKILNFFTKVLNDFFHSQISLNIFMNVINDFNNLSLINYFKSWTTKNISIELILNSCTDNSLMQNLLSSNEIDLKLLKNQISLCNFTSSFRTTIFCITQLTVNSILTETISNNCKNVIFHLLEESKNDSYCREECYKWIFNHPTILNSFNPQYKKKKECQKLLTKSFCEITTFIKGHNEFFNLNYILPYRNKLGEQLKSIFEKENPKFKNIMIELVDIFGINLIDATELLNKAIKFDKTYIINKEEVKLSDLGHLIPKLFTICLTNGNEIKLFENEDFIKEFVQIYNDLKVEKITELKEWEECMLEYFKKYETHISIINNECFTSFFTNNISSSLVQLLSFLVSKNAILAAQFIKIVSNNANVLKQSKVVFPIITFNLNRNWEQKFLLKLYHTYKPKITKYLIKPEKTVYWIPENKDAVMKIIKDHYEPQVCTEICQAILQNGDKINVLNTQYLELLEVLFAKNINDICNTQNFLLVLVFIMIDILKKNGKDTEKLNFLCNIVQKTAAILKSKGTYFEELSKSSSWPQFTRFSLKLGLNVSKNKEPNRLMKMLSEVCEVAYEDNGIEEYVKTMFEMTTSHSEFINIMLKNSDVKRDLLELLWTLIRKNNSVMLASQIPLYLSAYNATLSESDQIILMIIQFYEKHKKINKEYKPFLFGEAAAMHYSVREEKSAALWRQPTATQFFDLLDLELVHNTIKNFPLKRKLQDVCLDSPSEIYDPAFYLPLFYVLLAEQNVVPYKKFIRCGGLALSLIALTSKIDQMRLLAYNVIQRFYNHLIAASSKHDVLLWVQFLQVLGNGMQAVPETKLNNIKLSGFIAIFMAKVSLIMNEHPLYASLHAFIRAKPALNLNEIPEFLNFLHSSEVEHKTHRRFILEVIRDGMKAESDVRIAIKLHAFKLLFSFYNCVLANKECQTLILEIVEAATKLPVSCKLLVNNYALLPWLNQCVMEINPNDQRSVQLLTNISLNITQALKSTKFKSPLIVMNNLIASNLRSYSTT